MGMEKFGENQKPQPENKPAEELRDPSENLGDLLKADVKNLGKINKDGSLNELLDKITLEKIKDDVSRELKRESSANLLSGLKEKIIDPLYQNAWIKGERDIGKYEKEEELKSFLRKALKDHYKTFLIPGHVYRNFKTGETEIREPRSIGYEAQKMLLEKSGLLAGSELKFFDPSKEDQIPEKDLKKGLNISISDAKRSAYAGKRKEGGRRFGKPEAEPTETLHEMLNKAGFFDNLDAKTRAEILGTVVFADVIERNEWLDPTAEDFFDVGKINLFKVNRLLSHDQISGLIGDFVKDARFNWSNFIETREKIRSIVMVESRKPLGPELIRKYGLEKTIADQKLNVKKSKKYLEEGKNAASANWNGKDRKVIYVKNPSGKWKNDLPDRLPGQLPALAAKPPLENGRLLWEEKDAYFEVGDSAFLGYIKAENGEKMADKIENYAKRKGIDLERRQIGDWIKIYIPFSGKLPSEFEGILENNWLHLKTEKERRSEKQEAPKKERPGEYKKAANF